MDALPIDRQTVIKRMGGIAFVFWGLLIILIDLSINSFDIVNDFVGAILVAVGIFRLAQLAISRRYRLVMALLRILVVAWVLVSGLQQFPGWAAVKGPAGFWVALPILSISGLLAFFMAMQWLSQFLHLAKSLRSWVWTLRFGLAIYGAPLFAGGAFIATAFALTRHGAKYQYDLKALAVPAILIFSIPIFHFFLSLRRTLNEARTVL